MTPEALVALCLMAFVLALLFVPAVGSACADAIQRHSDAVRAAYGAYQNTWNRRRA